MRRILHEPLLHFVVLAALIFAAHGLMSVPSEATAPQRIVVTAGQIEHLATGFARTWQRPPSDAELKSLVDDWVREEIATREALALGLDRDDTVIRRRLRQKLEFVSEDIAALVEPTEADLDAYFRAHADAFRVEPEFTFLQVCFDPARHAGRLDRDVAEALAKLKRLGEAADPSEVGDSSLLEHRFESVPMAEVARQFGDGFAAALDKLTPGQWQGPVESGYGTHLVLVLGRTEARAPELAEVREAVKREWENDRRQDGNRKFYEEMLKRYTVTIEGVDAAGDGDGPVAAK